MKYLLLYLLIINIISFIVCYADKRAAIKHKSRVPEKRLFAFALLGGAVGMLLGMLFFRHKTRQWRFVIGIPLIILIQIIALYFVQYYFKIF